MLSASGGANTTWLKFRVGEYRHRPIGGVAVFEKQHLSPLTPDLSLGIFERLQFEDMWPLKH